MNKEIYKQIAEEQPYCQMCGSNQMLAIHHIIYGKLHGSRDDLTYKGNLIRLCNKCHNLVHSNKKKYQPILLEIIGGKE